MEIGIVITMVKVILHLYFFQPMIQYLNDKEIQGVYFDKRKERIHLPDAAEVCSDKYNNAWEYFPLSFF